MGTFTVVGGHLASNDSLEVATADDEQVVRALPSCGATQRSTKAFALGAVVELAEEHGAKAVEGFPLSAGPKGRADGFLGTEQGLAGCAFTKVAKPTVRRVVMRRDLRH